MKTTKKKATVERATGKVKEAGRQLADKASSAAESGKQGVVQYLEEQKEEAASKVRDLDQVLRRTAEEVSNPGIGKQLERLADEVDRLAGALESTHYDDVVRSVETFGRRNPTVFLATSFGLGIAVSRFLRASSRRPHGSSLYMEGGYSPSETLSTGTTGFDTFETDSTVGTGISLESDTTLGTSTLGTSTLGTSPLGSTSLGSTSLGSAGGIGTSTLGTSPALGTNPTLGTDSLSSDTLP